MTTPDITMLDSLTNRLLVSTPQQSDSFFSQSVTLLCRHNEEGALGVVLNRPSEYCIGDIFAKLDLTENSLLWHDAQVMLGGPVSPEVGLVLHVPEAEQEWESSLHVSPQLCLTSSRDILEAMAKGGGPDRALMCLGYASWSAGQLEEELKRNDWFHAPPDPQLIFAADTTDKWQNAGRLAGINMAHLSPQVGHA